MDVVARLRAAGCVFAEDEARLLTDAAGGAVELEAMVARRVAGEPIEYIVGWAEFRGRRYVVLPGVFVPRHRTELLVQQALARVTPGAVVLDLCCGCGALGAAVQREVDVELHAADIDALAVACAQRNIRGTAYVGDLFDALPATLRGRIDLLLVNAPYVPTQAIELMPPEARDHEARSALDGGADGTDVQVRVLAEAPRWLAAGATLLTETSAMQATRLSEQARMAGFEPLVIADDDATVLVATLGPDSAVGAA